MYSKLKNLNNLKLFVLYYIFYNFRLFSVLAIIYFAQITGSYTLALSLFAIAQIAQAVFEIPTGLYSDFQGRSSCLRLGAWASLVSIAAYAYGGNYWVLLAGVIFEGLNRACFSGNNDALLYETLKANKRGKDYQTEYGRIHSWLELAGLIGGLTGGIVAYKSLKLVFLLSVIPQIIAVVLSYGFSDPKRRMQKPEGIHLHLKSAIDTYRKNIKVRLVSFAEIIGFAIGESTWSFQAVFYNMFLPTWIVSFVMSLNFLTSTISFRLSGKILEKFSAIKVLLYQEVYSRALYLFALIFPTTASPFMMAAASVTYGPSVVAKSSLLQTEFTDHQRATMTSINSFAGNCLYAIVTLLFGYLADRYGATRSLLAGQIGLLTIVAIYYRLNMVKSKNTNPL